MHAYTTASVINFSLRPPEYGATVLDFMPNHPDRLRDAAPSRPLTQEESEAKDDFMAKVMQLSAELTERAQTGKAGPYMQELGLASKENHG